MNTQDGTLTFVSAFRQQVCYPCGTPRRQVVGAPGHQEVIPIPKPVVEFRMNRYTTKDPEIARGLIEDDMFAHREGWNVMVDALPETLRQLYSGLPKSEQRKVLIALIEDKTEDEAFEEVDPDAIESAKDNNVNTAFRLTCPITDCGLSVGGDVSVEQARAAMADHVRVAHPKK